MTNESLDKQIEDTIDIQIEEIEKDLDEGTLECIFGEGLKKKYEEYDKEQFKEFVKEKFKESFLKRYQNHIDLTFKTKTKKVWDNDYKQFYQEVEFKSTEPWQMYAQGFSKYDFANEIKFTVISDLPILEDGTNNRDEHDFHEYLIYGTKFKHFTLKNIRGFVVGIGEHDGDVVFMKSDLGNMWTYIKKLKSLGYTPRGENNYNGHCVFNRFYKK
ncbi:hypothetical protein GEMRC1_000850 [Eukaryota sp. GEM-RC1]